MTIGNTLILIFVAHWAGDFLLQTSSMAVGKSHSMKWLSVHVLVYSGTLFVFSLILFDLQVAAIFVLVNATLHWFTDFFTSKLASKYQNQPRIFYSVLGFDQLVHFSCLTYTYFNFISNTV
ncbi:MAG: DUF3307 domain-containing protein [Bacteroidota bacterium]